MKNREIIKNSILFPIRRYKEFALITLLFILVEIIQKYFQHQPYHDIAIIPSFLIFIILPLLVLGINLQIIFHIIGKKSGSPKLSLKKSLKEATHDVLLELYYYLLTILITIILVIPTGIFNNYHEIPAQLNNITIELEEINVIEIIGGLPNLTDLYYSHTIQICLIIFIVILTILFSMCTLGKIDMEINHNFKQACNIKYILSLIKKIGILKYIEFLILVTIICVIVANIVYVLKSSPNIGSFLSAFLESFSLVFFLNSFAQLYPK